MHKTLAHNDIVKCLNVELRCKNTIFLVFHFLGAFLRVTVSKRIIQNVNVSLPNFILSIGHFDQKFACSELLKVYLGSKAAKD